MPEDASGRPIVELFGTAWCPYTAELREQLLWDDRTFLEYDVETDAAALARMLTLTRGRRTVPVLVEAGEVKAIGWRGLGCTVEGGNGHVPGGSRP
jgi:mycoredoxin